MLAQDLIEQAKQTDIVQLVGQRVQLQKVSGHEWAGPCPKCGGTDRLHVTGDWWFCRQCHEKRGDAIGWLQFADGLHFRDAVSQLTGEAWPEAQQPKVQPQRKQAHPRPAEWFEEAEAVLQRAQAALHEGENAGAEYLAGRGLERRTWRAFGLGFGFAMNRDVNAELPAIAMPWYRGGVLTAIRWRFLTPVGKQKITSHPGSQFGGQLFGGQAVPEWVALPQDSGRQNAERLHTLVICEGEINAMSIWQVAGHTGLHVVSLGSETSQVSDAIAAFARRYGRALIWMDKREIAKSLVRQVANADGYASPAGQDANDMLRVGCLGEVLTRLRVKACRTDEEHEALRWNLWDAMRLGPELDEGTLKVYGEVWR